LRTVFITTLVFLILSSLFISSSTEQAHAQTGLIATAKSDIVAAFQAIQTAQRQGASNADLLPLIAQLNLALRYEENATMIEIQNPTAANEYANQAIDLSTHVQLRAQQLSSEAQSRSILWSAFAYSVSLLVAMAAAVAVIEAPQARRFFQKRRLRRSRVVYGGEKTGE